LFQVGQKLNANNSNFFVLKLVLVLQVLINQILVVGLSNKWFWLNYFYQQVGAGETNTSNSNFFGPLVEVLGNISNAFNSNFFGQNVITQLVHLIQIFYYATRL
jgi:hypothetical protein